MIAHIKPQEGGFALQSYREHARGVAELCSRFAAELTSDARWQTMGYVLGLLHDYGKLQEDFQRYIEAASGYTSRQTPHRAPHSATGAILLRQQSELEHQLLNTISYCISGHHRGLYDANEMKKRLQTLDEQQRLTRAREDAPDDTAWTIEALHEALEALRAKSPYADCEAEDYPLIVRMLFSCLVDADFLDTELFMDKEKSEKRKHKTETDFAALRDKFHDYTKEFKADSPINQARAAFLLQCHTHGATADRGIYSLFLPTGGGKTVSSMAWALEMAIRHKARHIIYVIPYTSIITQTAETFRKIFGEEVVLEHHSDIDITDEERHNENKFLAENWDAPIIVTTNVQLFESLYSHRVSRCRKLHNIARSIIVCDEVQMFPTERLNPMLRAIESLYAAFDTSILLCTATQPLFTEDLSSAFKRSTHELEPLGFDVEPIVTYDTETFSLFDRADFHLTPLPLSTEELALRLREHSSALCVVNNRKDARLVYEQLKKVEENPEVKLFHLSRMMCSAHLKAVLKEIKKRMKDDLPTKVISTQLIEAGVDLDFPVVYRANASLISIIQAGGRCNRNGQREEKGEVFVFDLTDGGKPFGEINMGIDATNAIRDRHLESIAVHDPAIIREYYWNFYSRAGEFDKNGVWEKLMEKIDEFGFDFECTSRNFHLIEDKVEYDLFVPYGEEGKQLVTDLRARKFERLRGPLHSKYRVGISQNNFTELCSRGSVEPITSFGSDKDQPIYLLTDKGSYSDDLGVLLDNHYLIDVQTV